MWVGVVASTGASVTAVDDVLLCFVSSFLHAGHGYHTTNPHHSWQPLSSVSPRSPGIHLPPSSELRTVDRGHTHTCNTLPHLCFSHRFLPTRCCLGVAYRFSAFWSDCGFLSHSELYTVHMFLYTPVMVPLGLSALSRKQTDKSFLSWKQHSHEMLLENWLWWILATELLMCLQDSHWDCFFPGVKEIAGWVCRM